MKKWSYAFIVVAMILSHTMCALVAYTYCNMTWLAKNGMTSAPAHVAFLDAVPFGIGIAVCIVAAFILKKKQK